MKKLFKDIITAFAIGILIFLAVILVSYFNGNRWTQEELLRDFVVNQLFLVSLYMANNYVINYMRQTYGERLFQLKNLVLAVFCGIVITIITIFLINMFLAVGIYGQLIQEFIETQSFEQYWLALLITALVMSVFYAFVLWKKKQDKKVTESRIIAGTASAQFDALKNQLDPHFLFNSLNVLTSLIDENPNQAQKFTTSLSKVYRYVLEQKNKELVSVEEELTFAKTYMNLIKMRFEDSIVFEMPESISNPDAKVVPLSLQLLLENAVKHNMVTPTKKLHIRIYEETGTLVVKNNKQLKQVVKKSSGVGLQNIKQRYYLLTDRQVQVNDGVSDFNVAIPMLTKQKSFGEVQEVYIEDKKYNLAKERVEKIKGFYVHLGIYLIMVPVFIWLNTKSTSFPWAIFPIFGWGMGVFGHATEAFDWHPILNKKWEERKMREFMDDDSF